MKRTFMDRVVGFFSPQAEANRIMARGRAEYLMRSYEAAQTYATDDWSTATSGGPNSETSTAQSILKDKGRDAVRNNPYANRALTGIVSTVVGSGILPNIKGNEEQVRSLKQAWKEWAETTLCDSNGRLNFYGLQALAMRSTIESGESLVIKEVNKEANQLRLIESDHIVSSKPNTTNGIKTDPTTGKPISYFLYTSHPGEMNHVLKDVEINVSDLCHVLRIDRPGQLRGVSWFHPVIRQLQDLHEFQQATLIGRKVAACFSVFISSNNSDATLSQADLIAKRKAESMVTPGSVKYLDNGETISLATPPKVDGYEEFCNQNLRSVASGLGITFELLTSNYSQVNFSSGRMGNLEFRKNVEMWRWGILIPQFCEPAFQHFLQWCKIRKGIIVDGVTVEWVPPAWTMIDPASEISATRDAIRSGLTSWPKAVREQGYDPDELLKEIQESNKKLDEANVILDIDPRKITKSGIAQVDTTSNQNAGDNNNVG